MSGCYKVHPVKRSGTDINWVAGRDMWWHDLMADPTLPAYVKPVPMNAEDPLYILYTSGSTGQPKGVLHTHGGYLLHCAMTIKLVYDLRENETFWCSADIGWVTGHSYTVYGPLCMGFLQRVVRGHSHVPRF